MLTSVGTLLTSAIIWLHSQALYGARVPLCGRRAILYTRFGRLLGVSARPLLLDCWRIYDAPRTAGTCAFIETSSYTHT